MNLRLQSLRFRSNLDQKRWDKAVREHAEIAKALTARDGVLVAQLLLAHVNNKREIVLKLLEQES
ncbi:MAG: FCD domain-containing protein [Burkholderiaceae bacterium]